MTNVISQSAGDRAILFGSIKKVGTINILKPDSSVGAKVTIAPSVHQLPQPRPLPVVLPPRFLSAVVRSPRRSESSA